MVASLPFAPEIVIPTVGYLSTLKLGHQDQCCGFNPSLNQNFRVEDSPSDWWVTPYYFGTDLGPVRLMYRKPLRRPTLKLDAPLPYLVAGLRRAGFTGGWL